jgi:8-oxo-dGTP diphosphatase
MSENAAADQSLLVADAHLQRDGGQDRKTVEVAVGILINAQNQFLLTSRPLGKVYESYWEFPGGKLEANETVEQALSRELE